MLPSNHFAITTQSVLNKVHCFPIFCFLINLISACNSLLLTVIHHCFPISSVQPATLILSFHSILSCIYWNPVSLSLCVHHCIPVATNIPIAFLPSYPLMLITSSISLHVYSIIAFLWLEVCISAFISLLPFFRHTFAFLSLWLFHSIHLAATKSLHDYYYVLSLCAKHFFPVIEAFICYKITAGSCLSSTVSSIFIHMIACISLFSCTAYISLISYQSFPITACLPQIPLTAFVYVYDCLFITVYLSLIPYHICT